MIISLILFYKTKEDNTTIPADSIRFRIIANSNSPRDQKIKEDIKKSLESDMLYILKDSKSINETRKLINNNMEKFKKTLNKETLNLDYSYNINYGLNYFPEKEFNGKTYKEGYYESLLVTLGEGKGDNFWCVLFPPFCIMEAEETKTNDIEYKLFIKNFIKNIFNKE